MVDTRDLKSLGQLRLCGFESHFRYHPKEMFLTIAKTSPFIFQYRHICFIKQYRLVHFPAFTLFFIKIIHTIFIYISQGVYIYFTRRKTDCRQDYIINNQCPKVQMHIVVYFFQNICIFL